MTKSTRATTCGVKFVSPADDTDVFIIDVAPEGPMAAALFGERIVRIGGAEVMGAEKAYEMLSASVGTFVVELEPTAASRAAMRLSSLPAAAAHRDPPVPTSIPAEKLAAIFAPPRDIGGVECV